MQRTLKNIHYFFFFTENNKIRNPLFTCMMKRLPAPIFSLKHQVGEDGFKTQLIAQTGCIKKITGTFKQVFG